MKPAVPLSWSFTRAAASTLSNLSESLQPDWNWVRFVPLPPFVLNMYNFRNVNWPSPRRAAELGRWTVLVSTPCRLQRRDERGERIVPKLRSGSC
jgi:uncharacterized RDD family membrane protein YckC